MAKSELAIYQQLNQQMRSMCKKAKEDWMEDQCNEIDLKRKHAFRTLHQQIKTVANVKKKTQAVEELLIKGKRCCMKQKIWK